MIPKVVQRPHLFSFSKNQLLWRVYVSYPTEAGCMLDIKLSANDVDLPVLDPPTYQTQIKPDADGYVNVYLQDVADSMLENTLPDIDGLPVQASTNIKTFTFQFRRISTAYPGTGWETDDAIFVVKGGIEQLKHDYNNYFLNYHAVNKPFATWKPMNSLVGIYDAFFISILFTDEAIPAWMTRVVAEWTDGTTDTIDTNVDVTVLGKMFFHLKAGAEALGINALAAGRQLWRYSIQARDQADDTIEYSERYYFYADYRAFYNTKIFTYFNSLGGLDFARILGEQEDDYQRSFAEAESFSGSLVVGEPALTQYLQTGHTRMISYKSDAGLQHTKDQTMALQELHVSNLIAEIVGGKYRRVWILSKGDKLMKKTDKKWAFPIEWRYGFTETVYTPSDQDLGTGDDDQVYDGITCPVATDLTATPDGDEVTFTWTTEVGVTYTIEYKLVAAGTWTVETPVTEPHVHTFAAGTYNWRIKTICTPDNHSSYVNGTNFTVV